MRADSIGLLETFLVVAEELNFRRAANRLNLDQSALTRRIQKLEDAIGTRLLTRNTHEVRLTEAGRYFYETHAATVAQYLKSISETQDVARGLMGRLRIGYMSFAAIDLMPRTIASFKKKFPLVSVMLHYVPTHRQKILLTRDELDVGFMIGPVHHPDLRTRVLTRDRLCLFVLASHPLAAKQAVTAADIAGLDLIIGDSEEWNAYRWHLQSLLDSDGVVTHMAWQVSSLIALMGLVRAGLGATILPASMAATTPPEIAVVPFADDSYVIETVLAWQNSAYSVHVQRFLNETG